MFVTLLKATRPGSAARETAELGDADEVAGSDEQDLSDAVDDAPATSAGAPDGDAASRLADGDNAADGDDNQPTRLARGARVLAYGVLPAVALLLGAVAGYLKWVDGTAADVDIARAESVQAAVDSTVSMLSYRPDTVEQNLTAARDRMTGSFRDSYTSLTNGVVIPGAKQRQISAVASVPAAASVSATANHAVVLVFVNQTTIIGNDAPTNAASSVRVTLENEHGRWLISQFDPV